MGCPVVHFEIGCKNNAKTSEFYAKMFDWNLQSYGGAANMIDTGSTEGRSINGHINTLGHEPHNYTVVYVQVPDIEASLKKAESLGGKRVVPIMEVPGMGHFAWMADPEGTLVGLWKPAMQG